MKDEHEPRWSKEDIAVECVLKMQRDNSSTFDISKLLFLLSEHFERRIETTLKMLRDSERFEHGGKQ